MDFYIHVPSQLIQIHKKGLKIKHNEAIPSVTLRERRTMMHTMPNDRSHTRVSWQCSKNCLQVDINESALYFSPNRPFNCDDAIIRAAADVNPDTTGADTKSTRKPANK